MGPTVIGVDPHKRSHTAVVLDDDEEIVAQLRVAADRRQLDRLLGWASDWPERIWAVENVTGLGRLLSPQLVMAGEQVVDVPASLSHRTRKPSGKSGRKTDVHDARSVAIAAAHPGRLRTVEIEDFSQALELILDRREKEAMRALKRQLSDVIYRHLVADQRRREAARGRTDGNETRVRMTCSHP